MKKGYHTLHSIVQIRHGFLLLFRLVRERKVELRGATRRWLLLAGKSLQSPKVMVQLWHLGGEYESYSGSKKV